MTTATHTSPGRRGPKLPKLALTDDERATLQRWTRRATLQRWTRRATASQALALRCRIVLACAEGEQPGGRRAAGQLATDGRQVAHGWWPAA